MTTKAITIAVSIGAQGSGTPSNDSQSGATMINAIENGASPFTAAISHGT